MSRTWVAATVRAVLLDRAHPRVVVPTSPRTSAHRSPRTRWLMVAVADLLPEFNAWGAKHLPGPLLAVSTPPRLLVTQPR